MTSQAFSVSFEHTYAAYVVRDNGAYASHFLESDHAEAFARLRNNGHTHNEAAYAVLEGTRTIHAVTIPGHGLFRAYDDDVEDIYARYANPRDNGRRAMLHDANEIATPVDFSDVSTSTLAIILASFTPGSSAL